MSIDKIVSDIISAFLSIIPAFLSIVFAVHHWRINKKSSLAEEIIIIAEELEAIIKSVRDPGHYVFKKSNQKNDDPDIKRKKTYLIPQERLNNDVDFFKRILSLKIKASLYFSEHEIKDDLEKYLQIRIKIIQASNMLILNTIHLTHGHLIEEKKDWEKSIYQNIDYSKIPKLKTDVTEEMKLSDPISIELYFTTKAIRSKLEKYVLNKTFLF
jgi:hypothetical protein